MGGALLFLFAFVVSELVRVFCWVWTRPGGSSASGSVLYMAKSRLLYRRRELEVQCVESRVVLAGGCVLRSVLLAVVGSYLTLQ